MTDEVTRAVEDVVEFAAEAAVESVQQEHAVETAAERVEEAADRAEAAAEQVHAEHVAPGISRDDLHSAFAEHVGPLHDRISALEASHTAPQVEDVAHAAAAETVAEIVDRVEEQAQGAEDTIEETLPTTEADAAPAETVAEVVGADVPPRKTHFMHRPLLGRRD
jgi:hypothetical protein